MLEIKSLRKEYGPLVAANNVSFALRPGDIMGFIGSNGAGKTTTIRMLSTLLEPTAGTATLFGHDLIADPMSIRRQIGYMPDFFGVYDDVKVWEYLEFFAHIYSVPKIEMAGVVDNVLELTDLTGKKDAYVQALSRGMQQRLCLARCLVHDPGLLLLDEPASGLDPRARIDLKELILELGRMGKMVIVSSHILPELSDFCNCVGVIEKGNLLAFGDVGDVISNLQPSRSFVAKLVSSPHAHLQDIHGLVGVKSAALSEENDLRIQFEGDHQAQSDLVEFLVKSKLGLLTFSEESINLETVFMRLTTGAVN